MMPAKTCAQRNKRLSHSLRVGSSVIKRSFLTSAISGVAVRADQQRHVIVLRRVVDVEDNAHLRIETCQVERREIRFGIKDQAIGSIRYRTIDEEERLHTPLGVSPST